MNFHKTPWVAPGKFPFVAHTAAAQASHLLESSKYYSEVPVAGRAAKPHLETVLNYLLPEGC